MAEVVARVLARDGARASADHPALLALWRLARSRQDDSLTWLGDLLRQCVPISLDMANGVYSYWIHESRYWPDGTQAALREAVVSAVRTGIQDAAALARALSEDRPYALSRLITQTGREAGPQAFAAWQDYLPPLLIEGARLSPDLIVSEIATLSGDRDSGIVASREPPPRFANPHRIERTRFSALFGDRVDEALEILATYDGTNPWAVRPKEEAAKWLAERRTARAATVNPTPGREDGSAEQCRRDEPETDV